MKRQEIYEEFNDERTRQLEKWGPQSWPIVDEEAVKPEDFGQGGYNDRATQICFHYGIKPETHYKSNCDKRTEEGTLAWADILLEECIEVIFTENLKDARKELVQLGAVVVSVIEDIDNKMQETGEPAVSSKEFDLMDAMQQIARYSHEEVKSMRHFHDTVCGMMHGDDWRIITAFGKGASPIDRPMNRADIELLSLIHSIHIHTEKK